MFHQQGRAFFAYTESRKSPEVKSFITDRKIIIELGYELLGYTFMGGLSRVKFGRRARRRPGDIMFSEREHLADAAFCNDIIIEV